MHVNSSRREIEVIMSPNKRSIIRCPYCNKSDAWIRLGYVKRDEHFNTYNIKCSSCLKRYTAVILNKI